MSLTYLVCFDIEDDKVRRKLGNALLAYGDRVQYSVFEVQLRSDAELHQLKTKMREILQSGESDTDDIRFYYLNSITLARSATIDDQPVGQFPSATIL